MTIGAARELTGLVGGGVVAGIVGALVTLMADDGNPLNCGDGMEGLGCGILTVGLFVIAGIVAATVVNYGVLRAARVPHAGAVTAVSITAFVAWWLAIDELIPGTNIAFLPIASPIAVLNVLAAGLFRALEPRKLVVLGVVGAVIVLAFPLTGAMNDIGSRRSRDNEQTAIATANFQTFVFGYLPRGFHADPPNYYKPTNGPAHVEVSAVHGSNEVGDPAPFTVTTFRVPTAFDPPNNCGSDRPDAYDAVWPCRQVAQTRQGEPIFVDGGATFSNRQRFFVRRGDTLIVLDTTSSATEMPLPLVVRIYDGLRRYRS